MLQSGPLAFAYRNGPAFNFPALDIAPAETVGLIGPSGSGKSTLLMLIAGLLEPTSGEIRIGGQNFSHARGSARDRLRGSLIGVVLQSFRLLPRMTVLENLITAQYLSGATVDSGAALATLNQLDIADLRDRRPGVLSQGQAQRAAIARAIVNRPKLLLADEPTSSLDDENAAAALSLLLGESRRLGAALLVVTHDSRVKAELGCIVALPRKAAG